ncbi:MAG: tyrosine-type recombinase/integrase [Gammaproteobacteria bacterium]|nr:tyrosine-type recombinase/integrase [Gammaproteobacteria bacterium]
MTPLRETVLRQMRLRGFSPRTVDSYTHALEELARFFRQPLDELVCSRVQEFLDDLITVRKLAWATVNVYFSACRFLYEQVLEWPEQEFSIPPRGRSGKRPGVLSREEVQRVINAPKGVEHRALLAMTYGSGLRLSEVIRLKLGDIHRDRGLVFVRSGKGHQDRYTVLSTTALSVLEDHWRRHRPPRYFFFGRDLDKPMHSGTAQQIYYQALQRSGVRRVGGIHVLRHCFATHLIEAGVDIYLLKRWMGHRALSTTGRYIHISEERIRRVRSPLDMLHEPEE